MSHVDEGILHAYLDGALAALADAGELPDGASAADVVTHLRVCADCRSRLEAERAVRESAGLILKDAGLAHIDVPPFTALDSPRRTRRWLPLSWAASVVLAVGAGWLGSEAWRAQPMSFADGDRVMQESAASTEAGPTGAAAGQTSTDAGPDQGILRSRTPEPSAAEAARNEGMAAATPASPAAIELPAAPSDGLAQAAAPPRQQAGAEPPSDAAAREQARTEPIGNVVADRSVAVSGDRAAEPDPRGRVITMEAAGAPPAELAQAAATRSFVPGAPGVRSLADARVEGWADAGAVPAAFDTILVREISGRMPFVPGAVATSLDSAQLHIVAGATGTSWEVARELGQTTVRIRQTLPTGEPVELVSWKTMALALQAIVVSDGRVQPDDPPGLARDRPAGEPEQKVAEPAAWSAVGPVRRLEDGRHEIIVHAGGSEWIAIRADLGEEALRGLVSRLRRPEPPTR